MLKRQKEREKKEKEREKRRNEVEGWKITKELVIFEKREKLWINLNHKNDIEEVSKNQ